MAAKETTSNPSTNMHLLVLIHGFWGNPNHLNHLRDTLVKAHSDADLHILIAQSNRENNTYDGIEVGAERITNEIHETIELLKTRGQAVTRFSIAGYSLGGLIARYVVGLLYADQFFEKTISPINFTTFASPHLGVRSPKKGYQVEVWNWLGSNLLSSSGQQLYLTDTFRDTGRPLLAILADPSHAFMKGLKLFKKRTAYANIQHDPAVPYYSAAFSKHDEFIDLEAVDLHYLQDDAQPDQEVILDPRQPVTKRQREAPAQTWLSNIVPSQKTRDALPFYAFAATVMPIGIPLFLANAGYQTYQSATRVKTHEAGGKFDLSRYRDSLFQGSQRAQDALVEASQSAGGEEFIADPSPELGSSEWPVLALTKEQLDMVDNLDAISFIKYRCHIRVRRAHAAIVVRQANSAFADGKVVVQHWASNFMM